MALRESFRWLGILFLLLFVEWIGYEGTTLLTCGFRFALYALREK